MISSPKESSRMLACPLETSSISSVTSRKPARARPARPAVSRSGTRKVSTAMARTISPATLQSNHRTKPAFLAPAMDFPRVTYPITWGGAKGKRRLVAAGWPRVSRRRSGGRSRTRSKFTCRAAGNAGVVHHPRLVHIPRPRLMEQTAVVPDDDIAGLPLVIIDARRADGEIDEIGEQRLGLFFRKARNTICVPADGEARPPRFGMLLDERAERRRVIVQPVAVIFAALVFLDEAHLLLAVVQRMIGFEVLDL